MGRVIKEDAAAAMTKETKRELVVVKGEVKSRRSNDVTFFFASRSTLVPSRLQSAPQSHFCLNKIWIQKKYTASSTTGHSPKLYNFSHFNQYCSYLSALHVRVSERKIPTT
jgi:hypothetical protein